MKTIRFEVDLQGNLVITPEGFYGQTCRDATRAFENVGQTTSDQDLPEAWQLSDETTELTEGT